jgi:hypothetical protein
MTLAGRGLPTEAASEASAWRRLAERVGFVRIVFRPSSNFYQRMPTLSDLRISRNNDLRLVSSFYRCFLILSAEGTRNGTRMDFLRCSSRRSPPSRPLPTHCGVREDLFGEPGRNRSDEPARRPVWLLCSVSVRRGSFLSLAPSATDSTTVFRHVSIPVSPGRSARTTPRSDRLCHQRVWRNLLRAP